MVSNIIIEVCEEEFDAQALLNDLIQDGCGAVVSFLGLTRGVDEGEAVLRLEFDAWKEHLGPMLEQLAESAIEKYNVSGVAIAHRTGIVNPGENIVAIHVCSAHRAEAFAACEWLIGELKSSAPLWKKEVKQSGAIWKAGLG